MICSFSTPEGIEVPAVTADQMRDVDSVAIEETGPNLYQMMENAGRSLALAALDQLGRSWKDKSVVVLAGTGGNGGGGICAARHLANRGLDVELSLVDEGRLADVPAQQLAVFRATDGRIAAPDDLSDVQADLIIDALIGYSLRGAPRGLAADLIRWADASTIPVLSLDVPSGVDSTTGEAPGESVSAFSTLTLALPKSGLDGEGVGRLMLADIGIPAEAYRRVGLDVPADIFGDDYIVPIGPRE